MRILAVTCLAAGLSLAACSDAPETEEAAGANPEAAMEEPEPDVVHARQALMDEMQVLMLPIDRARLGEAFDLADARVRAEAISAIMTAVPFLYPEGTDAESTEGNSYPSLALPAVWEHPDAFHEMAEHTAEVAFDLVVINDEGAFRARAAELREACNACHAMFQQGYEPAP